RDEFFLGQEAGDSDPVVKAMTPDEALEAPALLAVADDGALECHAALRQEPARLDQVRQALAVPQRAHGQDAERAARSLGQWTEAIEVDAVIAHGDLVGHVRPADADQVRLVVLRAGGHELRSADLLAEHAGIEVDVRGMPGEAP